MVDMTFPPFTKPAQYPAKCCCQSVAQTGFNGRSRALRCGNHFDSNGSFGPVVASTKFCLSLLRPCMGAVVSYGGGGFPQPNPRVLLIEILVNTWSTFCKSPLRGEGTFHLGQEILMVLALHIGRLAHAWKAARS